MTTLQHTMLTILACNNDQSYLEEVLPYTLFCDVVRMYTGYRKYSHFQINHDSSDCSWWCIPSDIKTITRESVSDSLSKNAHLAYCKESVLGGNINIQKFLAMNTHLPIRMYYGIYNHLVQDKKLDDLFRNIVDCRGMYEDTFYFEGNKINGEDLLKLKYRIELQGTLMLAYMVYSKYMITCNNDWINSYVYGILSKAYPKEMADDGIKRMLLVDSDVESAITNHDWYKMIDYEVISNTSYYDLYEDILKYMIIL